MRYIVTTHPGLDGARLSRPGHWGNLPFPTIDAAEAHARADAKGAPLSIERTRGKALRVIPR